MICRDLATVGIDGIFVQVEHPYQAVFLGFPALGQIGTTDHGQIIVEDHIHQCAVHIGEQGALAGQIPVHGVIIGDS